MLATGPIGELYLGDDLLFADNDGSGTIDTEADNLLLLGVG